MAHISTALFQRTIRNLASTRKATGPVTAGLGAKSASAGGIDVLNRMRSDPRTKLVPVVVLTSSSEDEDMLRSYESGANSYVRKPVDFAAFAEAVTQLGVFWLLHNQQPPRR